MRQYYIYFLGSRSGVLYTGVTNDLERRVWQHKQSAIEAEKRIKGWRREKKINLIESQNPTWRDLSEGWYDNGHPGSSRVADRTPATDKTARHSEGSGSDPRNLGKGTGVGSPARDSSSLRSSE